jgi:Mor family transcriptional regulator
MATPSEPDLRPMPELLTELRRIVADTLRTGIDLDADLADHIGHEAARRICDNWGGTSVYIPKPDSLERYDRDLQIWAEFDGRNQIDLARKYRVSLVWIYAICKRMRALDVDRRQGKLFAARDTQAA